MHHGHFRYLIQGHETKGLLQGMGYLIQAKHGKAYHDSRHDNGEQLARFQHDGIGLARGARGNGNKNKLTMSKRPV
jgi:hypothetical protein